MLLACQLQFLAVGLGLAHEQTTAKRRFPLMTRHVVAAATCVTADANGQRVRLTEGVVWSADDPIVLFRPELFRALADDPKPRRKVEQATAAPGETRSTSRTVKKAD